MDGGLSSNLTACQAQFEFLPEPVIIIPALLSAESPVWNIQNLPPYTAVLVFNELGQLIYETEHYHNTLTVGQLAAAMYFYYITPPGHEPLAGKFVVVK